MRITIITIIIIIIIIIIITNTIIIILTNTTIIIIIITLIRRMSTQSHRRITYLTDDHVPQGVACVHHSLHLHGNFAHPVRGALHRRILHVEALRLVRQCLEEFHVEQNFLTHVAVQGWFAARVSHG